MPDVTGTLFPKKRSTFDTSVHLFKGLEVIKTCSSNARLHMLFLLVSCVFHLVTLTWILFLPSYFLMIESCTLNFGQISLQLLRWSPWLFCDLTDFPRIYMGQSLLQGSTIVLSFCNLGITSPTVVCWSLKGLTMALHPFLHFCLLITA